MIEQAPMPAKSQPPDVSLLYVATVAQTIRGFLLPYAARFRAMGWRVDAAANGASADPVLREAFDAVYELPLSRSLLDVGGLIRGERAIAKVVASGPDIVHVHTPIASFVTRIATSRMADAERPRVAYTAHGFHFHKGGRLLTNAVFRTAEQLAGRWTDRLVVINEEDFLAAQRHRIIGSRHLVRMRGIGIDTRYFSRSSVGADDAARARRDRGLGAETPLFVVAAEYNRNKRIGDVVRAFASMRHREAELLLVGGGRDQAILAALAKREGVRDRTRIEGFVDDLRPLVSASTALVLPSKREGLSRSVMEALSLEVPVVASTARGESGAGRDRWRAHLPNWRRCRVGGFARLDDRSPSREKGHGSARQSPNGGGIRHPDPAPSTRGDVSADARRTSPRHMVRIRSTRLLVRIETLVGFLRHPSHGQHRWSRWTSYPRTLSAGRTVPRRHAA